MDYDNLQDLPDMYAALKHEFEELKKASALMAEREANIYKPMIEQNQMLIQENEELNKFIEQAKAMGLLDEDSFKCIMDSQSEEKPKIVGGKGGCGPAWTRGEIERPEGEKNMGSWVAATYTEEQQARLSVDEFG